MMSSEVVMALAKTAVSLPANERTDLEGLRVLVDECFDMAVPYKQAVATAFRVCQLEGFSPMQIATRVRRKMAERGISSSKISQYIPGYAKDPIFVEIGRRNALKARAAARRMRKGPMNPANYSTEDVPNYPRWYLVSVVRYLESTNETRDKNV